MIYDLDDEEFVAEVNDRYKAARDHQAQWRQEAEEDYAFVSGDQWAEEDKLILREQMRPIITFNRIGPVIDSVVGQQVQNRHETKFVPREIGDVGVNEVLTAAAKWIRDGSQSEDEETDAFMDSVVCGYGWMHTRMDYEEDPDGMVVEERVDPFEMYYDPSARKRNLRDARYIVRVKEFTKSEFEDKFGDVDLGGPDNIMDSLDETRPDDVDPGDDYRIPDTSIRDKREKYKVLEFQWYETVPYYRVADESTGQLTELEEGKYETAKKRAGELGIELRSVKMRKRKYYRAYVCRGTVLEKGEAPYEAGFNYKCITAKRDRNAGTFYGIVRAMKDPQRWANKWLSQVLHIINSNSKGGLLAEQDAFVNPRQAEEDWSNPNSITWMRPGGLKKVQEKSPINYPSGLDHLMQFAVASIRDTSGISMELLGLANRQQSNAIEQTRQSAGITILATLFDSLRLYYKENGRMLLWFIREYISDGRLVRIIGEDGGQQFVPLVRQDDTVKYDVIVDESPTSRSQKDRVWELIIQMMPILSTQPIPGGVWAELLRYSPLPQSVSSKIGQQLMQPQGPSPEEMKMQAEQQRTQAQMEVKQFEAETGRMAALGKIESDKQSNYIDMLETYIKASGLDVNLEQLKIDALNKADDSRLRADENRVREIAARRPVAGTG